ncbi:MAG TPA: FKBP-type peptidyl-prolyl cis-trans isomerase [Ilumatobacteraceae bacterium]|nr:FKBP-type peptidyl-prolyl cis-trans isomerase [Ilumatobacteraceae bacterium]
MGTAKRERQKANRQLRLEQIAKDARKRKSKKVAVRVGIGLVAVIGLVALINVLGGDDKSDNTSSADSTVTATTVAPLCPSIDTSNLAVIPPNGDKPTVTLPTEQPTELKVTTLVEGSGPAAANCDLVRVHYIGVLSSDGTEFDSSWDRGQTIDVQLGMGMVISGWEQGLLGVQAGGRYQFDIPADLAYGDTGSGDVIKPGDAITFVVDIMQIVSPEDAAPTGSTVAPTTT